MTALEYRCTMWICQKLALDRPIPEERCAPIALFEYMMETHHSWGRYAIYMTWLHRHFPTQGSWIFRYLKTHYSSWTYSLSYLLAQWFMYHGAKTVERLCRSFPAWLVRRCG